MCFVDFNGMYVEKLTVRIVISVGFDKYSSRSINLYMYIYVFSLCEWYLNLYNISHYPNLTVKCLTAIKTMLLYFSLCLSVRLDSLSFYLYRPHLPFGIVTLFWAYHWVMVEVLTAPTHRAVHCVPGWRIRESPSMGRCQVAIAGHRTIVDNVFGDCHDPCPLNISVVNAHVSRFESLNCLSLLHTFSVAVKCRWLGGPISIYILWFLYIIELYWIFLIIAQILLTWS